MGISVFWIRGKRFFLQIASWEHLVTVELLHPRKIAFVFLSNILLSVATHDTHLQLNNVFCSMEITLEPCCKSYIVAWLTIYPSLIKLKFPAGHSIHSVSVST